jgi:predicted DNA-binding transcriptional regulator AlpA
VDQEKEEMARILRPAEIMVKLGIRKSKFWDDYAYNKKQGGKQFIPGTRVEKLKLISLGPRSVGGLDHEVEALIEGLAAER